MVYEASCWPRRVVSKVGALALLVLLLTLALPPVSRGSESLPEGRVYEQVTPAYKAGQNAQYGPQQESFYVARERDALAFQSLGVFAGSPSGLAIGNGYLATRGEHEWDITPTDPPASLSPLGPVSEPLDYNPNLTESLSFLELGKNLGARSVVKQGAFYLRKEDDSFTQVSPLLGSPVEGEPLPSIAYRGASANFSTLVLSTGERLLASDTNNEFTRRVYEVAGADTSSPSLELVSVDNNGNPTDPLCNSVVGTSEGSGSVFHAVSSDGSRIYFTANTVEAEGRRCDSPLAPGFAPGNPAELFVRIDGIRTLKVSEPVPVQCTAGPCTTAEKATATFQGASEGGKVVFFTTKRPLVNADVDSTNDLYMAEVGENAVTKLAMVSEGDTTDVTRGEGAGVQGVARISNDGTQVWFVAQGVLTTAANGLGESAIRGADNLYEYQTTTASMKFVATLCSGFERSGSVSGYSFCPGETDRGLWRPFDKREIQVSENGRYLVFSTSAQLIRSGPQADTDAAKDVYRYDSSTGTIERVSVGETGFDNNGNDNESEATIQAPEYNLGQLTIQQGLSSRAVSADGSTVVFSSWLPLSAKAHNDNADVYVWKEGAVGLISGGMPEERDGQAVISASGRNIFFGTTESLAPNDTDGVGDIYDARIGGGFPTTLVGPAGCNGDACQGEPGVVPTLLAPASLTLTDEGAPSAKSQAGKPKKHRHKRKRHRISKHKGSARRRRGLGGRRHG